MSVPWIPIWQGVFLVGTALFAVMSVWVTVQGWDDVRSLFAALAAPERRPPGRRNARRRPR